MIFWLADRWGEPDPAKIAALPVDTLNHWKAFFIRQGVLARAETQPEDTSHKAKPSPSEPTRTADRSVNEQCNAVMRALM
ncbi:hypothetical protein BOM23_08230 [Erwinia sp. OLMDLW33]|nr:hypothetical protein BOM23_08230 [Erwinia sp. OLMDLW33]